MDRMDFTQGVVRTRVIEKRLLSRAQFDRMVDAEDLEEVLRILNETEYSSGITKMQNPYDYESVLSGELIRVYDLMRDVSVNPMVIDLLALKYDYHNLKVLIKEKELKQDLSSLYLPIGATDFKALKEAFDEGNLDAIPSSYRDAIKKVQEDYDKTRDPQRIDLIFDRYYYQHFTEMAKESAIEFFLDYVKDMIDFTNVSSSIRLKRQGRDEKYFDDIIIPGGNIDRDTLFLIIKESLTTLVKRFQDYRISSSLSKGLASYEKTDRLTDFEKYKDDYLMEINKLSKNVLFGPEPIFSYVAAKETEIKNLRIVMVSKVNHISAEAIRERMRDLYV